MFESFIFLTSGTIAFYAHEWTEKLLAKLGKKKARLIVKGRQIHHSFFGALAIVAAFLATGGVTPLILLGYGAGNIWQHKITHNRVNESGLVFITKKIG